MRREFWFYFAESPTCNLTRLEGRMPRCRRFGVVFALFALGFATNRLTQGQTLSLYSEFTSPWVNGATALAADASGIYLFAGGTATQGGLASAAVGKYDFTGK